MMLRKGNKWVGMRLHIPHSHRYFEVTIYDYVKDMRRERKQRRGVIGFCRPLQRCSFAGRRPRYEDKCGDIYLCGKHLGISVVAHEISHAALAYYDWNSLEEPWEEICYAIGDMTSEFYRKAERAGIIQ
jgi:hypothetical protein